ncbi:Serine/threonine protein kinase [Pedococcus cremeus]|uniref:Serine/threonine protein kinase n=1 Tax=Pedococcus cremeus TaxID=587636 RepID=A0A1H9VIY1_9MICO|nr:serine/threonine-protein kinase [Pedococcus cremeus]SES21582.1 Serine/threonine protein kinase [Pedococcus cremeus]
MTTEAIGGAPGLPGGASLGPYRLVQQLGEGGMGVVHLALDPSGRAVALKLLRPHIAYDPAARSRLAREVEVLGRVDDPRVAAVIDADLDGDQPYVVTRYVPGPSLDEVVREQGPLEGQDLLRLGRGLAGALDAIHAADVIHRDLKPANVLMLDGDPVVIDFGIAHVADDVRITMTGLVMGTPGYLSPEVVEGAPVTEATDWWGWAATLAFAASGTPPFGRGPMDVVLSRVSRGEADLSGVDPRLAPLLYAALSPDARRRPDADEVVEGLERYAAGRPATEVLPSALAARHTEVIDQRSTRRWEQPPPVGRLSLPVDSEPYTRAAPEEDDSVLAHWDEQPSDEVSDWQAAWEADPQEPDPRIGRPQRSGTLLALLLVVAAVIATVPVVGVVLFVLWCWVARTAERSVTSLVLRRHHRGGPRRSDVPMAVAASPWHVVVGALGTLGGLLLPLLVGVSAVFSTALAWVGVAGGSPEPNSALPLAVGGLLAVLVAWWGPGGAALRRGTRSVVRGLAPGARGAQVAVVAGLLVAAGLALWSYQGGGVPTWWPWQSPSEIWAGLPGLR